MLLALAGAGERGAPVVSLTRPPRFGCDSTRCRSKACFCMGEFETAKAAFEAAISAAGKEAEPPRRLLSTASLWLRRCVAELDAEEQEEEEEGAKEAGAAAAQTAAAPGTAASAASSAPAPAAASAPPARLAAGLAPQGFIRKRFDWFQTGSEVVITVFAKGAARPLPEGSIVIEEEAAEEEGKGAAQKAEAGAGAAAGAKAVQVLVVDIPHTPPGATEEQRCRLRLRLGGSVAGPPRVRAGSVNVEITLSKDPAVAWGDLQRLDGPRESLAVEGTVVGGGLRGSAAAEAEAAAAAAAADAAGAAEAAKRPVMRGPADWAAMEKDIERVAEEAEGKPEGEEALQALFRQIYANGTPETRRAMNKSFQQSGGTVLSTNWEEVTQKDYSQDRQAPDGMEWKTMH